MNTTLQAMSERRPIIYSDNELEKILYKSSEAAKANAGVLWWEGDHEDATKNNKMIPFFNRNLDRSRGDVLLVEGYPYGVPIEGVFEPQVDAFGFEINPVLLVLNKALDELAQDAARRVVKLETSDEEYADFHARFRDSYVNRTKYSLVPAMNNVWESYPDARNGVVFGLAHVFSDNSMTEFLPREEQIIVREHKLVSGVESFLAPTMIDHGGFVILGDRFDFGPLKHAIPQPPPPPRPVRRRWVL